MFNRIREAIYEQSQQVQEYRNARFADEGRRLEDISTATCPECDRATVVLEHEYTPQLHLMPSEDRETTWYQCEWCGAEIMPELVNGRASRKPAGRAESEMEWARRQA
jgi:hypothetical protein